MSNEIVEIDLDGVISDCARGNFNPAGEHVIRLLVDKLREAEADAKRYRWLRDVADGFQVDGCMQLNGDEWDAKIDGVMSYEAS